MKKWCLSMGWVAIASLVNVIFWGLAASADQADREVRYYVESRGGISHNVLWCLNRGEGFRLTCRGSEGVHTTRTDDAYDTLSWSIEDPANETSIRAERHDSTISIRGEYRGKAVDKQVDVDADPWFQASSFSLRGFVVSDRESIRFWTLRSNTLKPYKLQATKMGLETITVRGEPVAAARVELRLTGWKGPFWKSDYWYRPGDGLLLRFEGAGDAVGSYKIIIAYAGAGERCEPSGEAVMVDERLDLRTGKR